MRVRPGLVAVLAGVLALSATACGGDERPEPPAVSQQLEAPPDAPAVELRAELASLLEKEVFLVAHAVRTGVRLGFDSALYREAEQELEHVTDQLVGKVAPLFDPFEQNLMNDFDRRLDRLVDLLLGYGRAQAKPEFGDIPFRQEIQENRRALRTILLDSSRALSDDDLDEHLELTIEELLLALDRLALDHRGQLAHAASAAHRVRGLAGVLAVAVTEDSPDIGNLGSPLSEPARLYADLRTLLEEDYNLIFGAVQVGLANGFGSPLFRTSSLQVDESANLFADRFGTIPRVGGIREIRLPDIPDPTGSLPDDEFEAQVDDASGALEGDEPGEGALVPHHRAVRDLLRRHWQLFELYAREAADEDSDGVPALTKDEISDRLHIVTTFLADVLADQTAIERRPLAARLHRADEALLEAIEALARQEPGAYAELVEALDHVADAMDLLVDGVIFTQVTLPDVQEEP